jgi:quinol monooxygenase YgiN
MSLHFLAAIVGALVAAAGTGVLTARCLRVPNLALASWTVALFGLTVALGAQALGFEIGFGPVAFRAMELGAQVVAPLALALGLAELAGRSITSRFAARLTLTALAILALVIFATDPLSSAGFSKAWPATGVYYQIVPNKLLEYVLAPATLIVALIAMGCTAARPGRDPAWRDALAPAGAAGGATLLLAVPGIATLLSVNVPLASLFVLFCLVAAAATWFAGVAVGRLSLAVLHQSPGEEWGAEQPWSGGPQTGDLPPVSDDEFGIYRSNGSRVQPADPGYGGAPGYREQERGRPGGGGPGYPGQTGYPAGRYPNADRYPNEAGHLDDGPLYRDEAGHPGQAGYRDGAGYAREGRSAGDRPRYRDEAEYPSEVGYPGEAEYPSEVGYTGERQAAAGPDGAQMFGQIAIYTLLEDRVDDFDELTRRVVRQVREHEPGTLVYIVHAVPSAPMQRILYEVYRDRAAYDAHKRQPYVSGFEQERRPYVLATNIIELGLQQAKVSPLPSVTDLLTDSGFDLLSDTGFGQPGYGPRPPSRGGRSRG